MIQSLCNNCWGKCNGGESAGNSCCDGRRNYSRGCSENLGCRRVIGDCLNRRERADNNRSDYGRLGCVKSSTIGNGHRIRSYRGEGCGFRRSTNNSAEDNIGGSYNFRCRDWNQCGVNVRDCVVIGRPYRLGASHGNRVGTDFRGRRGTNHLNIVSRCLLNGLDRVLVNSMPWYLTFKGAKAYMDACVDRFKGGPECCAINHSVWDRDCCSVNDRLSFYLCRGDVNGCWDCCWNCCRDCCRDCDLDRCLDNRCLGGCLPCSRRADNTIRRVILPIANAHCCSDWVALQGN